MRVAISVNDPWELGEALNWQQIHATVLKESPDTLVVRLDSSIEFDGVSYQYLRASTRYEGENLSRIQAGRVISCNFIGLTRAQFDAGSFDTGQCRGGLAFLGTVGL
jgi:hypothetical protein